MVGQVGVLITDHGPHPADKWAAMTAHQIINDIVPKVVLVDDDETHHDVLKSAHPKVAEFRKAINKYEDWIRDDIEEAHARIQEAARAGKPHGVTMDVIEDEAKGLIEGAKQFHVGLHGHMTKEKAAVMERLRLDFGSIMDIEHQYRADGFTVDENHVARKAG